MSITPTPDHPRCLKMAREQHEILEALELSPQVPAEALLPLQTSLLVACSVLPHEESHISWCQDKLARLECLGYVFLPGLSGWWCDADQRPAICVRRTSAIRWSNIGLFHRQTMGGRPTGRAHPLSELLRSIQNCPLEGASAWSLDVVPGQFEEAMRGLRGQCLSFWAMTPYRGTVLHVFVGLSSLVLSVFRSRQYLLRWNNRRKAVLCV
jgi:hypothetical protein